VKQVTKPCVDKGNGTGKLVIIWIEEYPALITLLAVWSAIILNSFTHVSYGQMESGQVISYVLTVIAFSGLIAVIPSLAVAYGWYSKKPAGAVLVGTLLFPTLYLMAFIVVSRDNMIFIRVTETVLYLSVLSVISGLAGYCAAQRTQRYLAVAIVLTGVWVFVMMSGFN
jgi:hypothetical protein